MGKDKPRCTRKENNTIDLKNKSIMGNCTDLTQDSDKGNSECDIVKLPIHSPWSQLIPSLTNEY